MRTAWIKSDVRSQCWQNKPKRCKLELVEDIENLKKLSKATGCKASKPDAHRFQ